MNWKLFRTWWGKRRSLIKLPNFFHIHIKSFIPWSIEQRCPHAYSFQYWNTPSTALLDSPRLLIICLQFLLRKLQKNPSKTWKFDNQFMKISNWNIKIYIHNTVKTASMIISSSILIEISKFVCLHAYSMLHLYSIDQSRSLNLKQGKST